MAATNSSLVVTVCESVGATLALRAAVGSVGVGAAVGSVSAPVLLQAAEGDPPSTSSPSAQRHLLLAEHWRAPQESVLK